MGALCALWVDPNGEFVMSEPDGGHSCPKMTHEMIQEESEDPGPRHLRRATGDVNGRHRLRA